MTLESSTVDDAGDHCCGEVKTGLRTCLRGLAQYMCPFAQVYSGIRDCLHGLFHCWLGLCQCVCPCWPRRNELKKIVCEGLLKCFSGMYKCLCPIVECCTPLTLTVVILWLVYRPDRIHPCVDSAVLSDLSDAGDGLRYNLSVDISFRNSHRLLDIRCLDVDATAFYNDIELSPADESLPAFYQGPKNTTVVHPAFHGVATRDTAAAALQLAREQATGTLHLRVTVSLTLMYKVWFEEAMYFHTYNCRMSFPPPNDGTPAVFNASNVC